MDLDFSEEQTLLCDTVRSLGDLPDHADQEQMRVQFGQPIGAFQAIAHYLADAATEIEGARWLVYQAAWAADTGRPFAQLALMAKLQAGAVFRRARHQQLMYWDPAYLERRIAAGVFG